MVAVETGIGADVDANSVLNIKDNIIILTTVSLLVAIFLAVTAFIVHRRGDIQPLKIRSSKLLFVSVVANLMIVVQVFVIQLSQEVCINTTDNFDTIQNRCKYEYLELFGLLFGFLIISTAEPLAFVSQVLRAIRLRRIIDAQ